MSKQLQRILLFALGFVLINTAVTLYFNKVSIRGAKLQETEDEFKARAPKHIPILAMGNSKFAMGLDTTIIPQLHNYASGGETNVQSYWKLKHLLDVEGYQVDTIFLQYGLFTVSHEVSTYNLNSFYWKKYIDYLDVGKVSQRRETYAGIYGKTKIFPWYEYPYLKMQLMLGDIKTPRQLIREENFLEASEKEQYDLALKRVKTIMRTRESYSKTAMHYFQKNYELCQKHNIHIIYFKVPETKPYRVSGYSEMNDHQVPYRTIDSLVHTNGFEAYNFEAIFDGQQQYYRDSHHLNEAGRKKFTQLIKDTLKLSNSSAQPH